MNVVFGRHSGWCTYVRTCDNKEPHVHIHSRLLVISSVVVGAGGVPEGRLAATSAFSSREGFADHTFTST